MCDTNNIAHDPINTVPTVKYDCESIMQWGCFSAAGSRTYFVKTEVRMDGAKYWEISQNMFRSAKKSEHCTGLWSKAQNQSDTGEIKTNKKHHQAKSNLCDGPGGNLPWRTSKNYSWTLKIWQLLTLKYSVLLFQQKVALPNTVVPWYTSALE